MPAGVVYVGRPTRWGNPYRTDEHGPAGAVALYRARVEADPVLLAEIRAQLGGRVLACWCRLDAPCHADVLLQLANTPPDGVRAADPTPTWAGPGDQSSLPPTPSTSTCTPTTHLFPRPTATAVGGAAMRTGGAA